MACLSAVLALVVLLTFIALAVDRYGQLDRAAKAPAIVMLGARVREGGVASGSLRARAEKAAQLYLAGIAPLVVFSGGVGENPPSEAQVAHELAAGLGVPRDACLLEDQSHSTAQNARFTAKLLRERGIREVVLVSDPYHLLRSRQYFWREGISVHPSGADYAGRGITARDRVFWTVREALILLSSPTLWTARPPDPKDD